MIITEATENLRTLKTIKKTADFFAALLIDTVLAESNITLLLDTAVFAAEKEAS